MLKMTWTPAIKDGSWGTLDVFEMGNNGASLRIRDNLAGSSISWYVTSDPVDEYFVDGGVYWFRLQVLPEAIGAKSGSITFRVPSKGTASPSTTPDMEPTAPGSTAIATMVETSTATAFESETSVDMPKATTRYYKELLSSDGQGPSSSVMTAIAMGGGVLGICLIVLLGLFIYRRRLSSTGDSTTDGGHEAAVGNLPKQQGDTDASLAETETFTPQTKVDGSVRARSHTVANGGFHEIA